MFRSSLLLLIGLVLAALPGCKGAGSPGVRYGVGQQFLLRDGEVEAAVTKPRVKVYEALCAPGDVTLPINRIVEAQQYAIYISFADSALSTEHYVERLSSDSAVRVVAGRAATLNSASARAIFFHNRNVFITQYWKPASVKGMQEVFTLVAQDSSFVDSVYNNDQFFGERIRQSEDQ